VQQKVISLAKDTGFFPDSIPSRHPDSAEITTNFDKGLAVAYPCDLFRAYFHWTCDQN